MGRIIDYPEKTGPGSGDYLLVDSSSDGTNKILAGNIVTVDPTLTQPGQPADAKKTGDEIDSLKADLDNIPTVDPTLTQAGQAADAKVVGNDFDILLEDIARTVDLAFDIVGFYRNGNLNNLITSIADSRSCIITVSSGEIYQVSGQSNYDQKLACVYDVNDNILLSIFPENTTKSATDYEFVIPDGGVKMSLSFLHNYPAYAVTLKKITRAIKPIDSENLNIFEANAPVNLFDYASTIDGAYMASDGSITSRTDMCYAYVPVDSGDYVLHAAYSFFGSTANRIPMFDAGKAYIGTIIGIKSDVIASDTNLQVVSISVPSTAKYIGVTCRKTYKNLIMVVKASEMPSEYVPYFDSYISLKDSEKVNARNVVGGSANPLYLKTVAFDGDSICRGTSAADGKNGWAGRIGTANGMIWRNFGISGGTITNNSSHCILTSFNDIYNQMPSLDYYIFEGGTNDADIIKMANIGSVTDNDYSGNYDITTFSGAFETLIYNVLTAYPSVKIGYIVAQKMGKTNNANYVARKSFFDRAMAICKKWGIPYINLWDESPLNPNLVSMYDASLDAQGNIDAKKLYVDGQHLTPTGYDVITPKITEWMKGL